MARKNAPACRRPRHVGRSVVSALEITPAQRTGLARALTAPSAYDAEVAEPIVTSHTGRSQHPPRSLSQRTLEGLRDSSLNYFLGGTVEDGHRYTMNLVREALGASRVFLATWTENGFTGRVLVGGTPELAERFERRPLPPFPQSTAGTHDGVLSVEIVRKLETENHWLAEFAGSDSVVLASGSQPQLHPICVIGLGGLGEIDEDQRLSIESFAYLLVGSVVGEWLDTQRMLARDRQTSSLETLADEVDAERRRMSHQIHDGVLQNVSSIAHFLETLSVTVEDNAVKTTLERLRVEAQGAAITLRQLVTDFEPEQSSPTTLTTELHELAARSSKLFGLTVHVDIDKSVNDHPAAGTVLWVVRQALDNAIAHADASVVTVVVEQDADDLRLTIEDDGNGFDTGAPWNPGVGLRSMHGRVREHGGTLEVNAEVGAGTRLLALFPRRLVPLGGSGPASGHGDQIDETKQRIRSTAIAVLDQDQRPTITSVALRAGVERREVLARFSSVDEIVADAISSVIAMIQGRWAKWPPIDLDTPFEDRIAELVQRRFLMEQWGRPIRNIEVLGDPTPRFDHEVVEALQPELRAIEGPDSAHLAPMVAWLLRPRSIRAIVQSPDVDPEAARATLQSMVTSLLTSPNPAASNDGT